MIVYKAVNKINGNTYIGKTTGSLHNRKRGHLKDVNRHSNTYFHRAIKKYGSDNFEWSVIQKCITENHLILAEQAYIELYKINGIKLYNMTEGGEGTVGYKQSEELKRKKSIFFSGENNPMYGRSGKNSPNYGKPRSEETKKRIGDKQKGDKNHNYGKKASEETRKKRSQTLLNGKAPNKGKKGILNPLYKRQRPDSVKKQISETKRKNYHPFRGVKGKDHYFSKAVYQIDKNTDEIIKKWDSITEAQQELKIKHISSVCNNKRKTAGGFKWVFVKNYPL